MISTWSTVWATSASRWLETSSAALRGEGLQEGAQPAHAGRIESVRGLVEDQQLGVAEQGGGEAEALLHPE